MRSVATPSTREVLQLLRVYESPNVTFQDPAAKWPMVWSRARGCHVWDPEGRRYLDLTAAFGVAAIGHSNPVVVRAGRHQMGMLLHAMGDVHPHPLKAQLLRELSALTFERWGAGGARSILGSAGFEAVEAALKTARLATGRPGIVAFQGAYHGLGYGALNATERGLFRDPFRDQLREFGTFVPFPTDPPETTRDGRSPTRSLEALERTLKRILKRGTTGAILVEPIQARGGIRIPPHGFLPLLRQLCDEHGVLLVLDEIYTGLGRTGRWFACEHSGVVPDLLCLGKALTGGFPLSACVGKASVMEAAWPKSHGEALHTSTFLGHPVGCAMALAQIAELRRRDLPARAAREGEILTTRLQTIAQGMRRLRATARGLGLMVGLELHTLGGQPAGTAAVRLVQRML
ncbi:MAG: aspartate aminotransferase family protein, partial [Verrucomicrobiales bacterium]|nr:aspartate aminotransferase family protein [Verrucomicrobiales bacterium]